MDSKQRIFLLGKRSEQIKEMSGTHASHEIKAVLDAELYYVESLIRFLEKFGTMDEALKPG